MYSQRLAVQVATMKSFVYTSARKTMRGRQLLVQNL